MGDLLEYTSMPTTKLKFFKITSGALQFSVRALKNYIYEGNHFDKRPAAVGLARRPGDTYDYMIVIRKHGFCLMKNGSQLSNKEVPNLFIGNEFHKFWVSWHGAKLQFGRTSDGIPLITKKFLVPNIQYVTFCSYGDRGLLQWQVFLPPYIEKRQFKQVTSGDIHWVKSDGQLPNGAMIGGYEREILYIIRAQVGASIVPGFMVPSQGTGYVTFNGHVHKTINYEVLCGFNCIWVQTCDGRIPLGAVEGGYDEDCCETLYIGRAVVDCNLLPGKAAEDFCIVSYEMQEFRRRNYDILVIPNMPNLNPNYPSFIDRIEHSHLDQEDTDTNEQSSDSEV